MVTNLAGWQVYWLSTWQTGRITAYLLDTLVGLLVIQQFYWLIPWQVKGFISYLLSWYFNLLAIDWQIGGIAGC